VWSLGVVGVLALGFATPPVGVRDNLRVRGFGVPDGELDVCEMEDLAEAGVRGDLNALSSLMGEDRWPLVEAS
jgi:hypothetical protein